MTAVFSVMPREERDTHSSRYLAHLREKEGLPNLTARTLPKREAFFRSLEERPIPITRPLVDQAIFDLHLRRRAPAGPLDERTMLALAVAKVNRAERFGIEFKLRKKGFEPKGADDPYTFIEIQELYHTRAFLSILETIGIRTDVHPPSGATRALVASFGVLPHFLSDIIALASEVAGIAAFQLLRGEARRLLEGEPDALARVEALFTQILTDEHGHVRFLRSRLGRARLWSAKMILPIVARALVNDMAEFVALVGRRRFLAAVAATSASAGEGA